MRITAQRLADDRIEFALQEREADGAWGARLLTRARFFPATATVGRWLLSTPLTVSLPEPEVSPDTAEDGGSVASDRAALVALYNATGGASWSTSTNWLSDRPLDEWHGVTTNSVGRVTLLLLSDNELTGPIPAELGDLSNLEWLWLSGNELTGPIPAWLGDLSNLEWLNLGDNQLTGPIPAELGDLSNLHTLDLSFNQLTGPIPAELGDLTNLHTLDLSFNQLTGPIPAELGDLTNLVHLYLGGNQLSGPIPAELGNPTNLRTLYLSGNQLTGCVPVGLRDVVSNDLWELDLPDCGEVSPDTAEDGGSVASDRAALVAFYNATGGAKWRSSSNWLSDRPIGEWYGVTTNGDGRVTALSLQSHRLTGPIPAALGDLTNLESLNLGFNPLTGPIPATLGDLTNLEWLNLGFNPS